MVRQVDAGKKYLLSNSTASKLNRLLGTNKGLSNDVVDTDSNIIAGSNVTGTDFLPFRPVLIYDTIFEEDDENFDEEIVFEIAKPAANETRIGITREPIPAQEAEIGAVQIGGTATAVVDILDVNHTHARVGGSGELESANSGPLRLFKLAFEAEREQLVKVKFETQKPGAGMVHGTLAQDITDSTSEVDVNVTFSLLEDVSVDDTVTAMNVIGYAGSLGGDAIVWYHGDGTGNEDGTFTLMGARCPTE